MASLPDKMSPKEYKFLELYLESYDMGAIAKKMGLALSNVYRMKAKPAVQAAIDQHHVSQLSEIGNLSTTLVLKRLQDPKVSDRFLIDVWKEIRRTMGEEGAGRKELHEMTMEELSQATADAKAMLATMANITPADQVEGLAIEQDSGDIFE